METRIAPETAAAALADIERTRTVATRRRRTPVWLWHAFSGVQILVLLPVFLLPADLVGYVAWVAFPIGLGIQALFERRMAHRMFTGSDRARRIGRWYVAGVVAAIAAAGVTALALGSGWPFAVGLLACHLLTVRLGPLSERDLDAPGRPVAR